VIGLDDLVRSSIDWSQFSFTNPDELKVLPHKTLRPHQQTALDKVVAGFETHDRGKLIMACGTGKTFTSLKIAEHMVGAGGSVLSYMAMSTAGTLPKVSPKALMISQPSSSSRAKAGCSTRRSSEYGVGATLRLELPTQLAEEIIG